MGISYTKNDYKYLNYLPNKIKGIIYSNYNELYFNYLPYKLKYLCFHNMKPQFKIDKLPISISDLLINCDYRQNNKMNNLPPFLEILYTKKFDIFNIPTKYIKGIYFIIKMYLCESHIYYNLIKQSLIFMSTLENIKHIGYINHNSHSRVHKINIDIMSIANITNYYDTIYIIDNKNIKN